MYRARRSPGTGAVLETTHLGAPALPAEGPAEITKAKLPLRALPAVHGGEPEPLEPPLRRRGFAALTLGAVGVVFGDIGTSPLYALREALAHARPVGPPHIAVLGVVSLVLWALILIVTIKYVVS